MPVHTPTLLYLSNTLTRTKEAFKPLVAGEAKIYTCGPTVYNYAHIGNLRSYVFPDLLKKLLLQDGYAVEHIINFTDVGHLTSDADDGDDKMEKAAATLGKNAWELAAFYSEAFKQDLEALNIAFPTRFTPATQYIQAQIDLVSALEKNGLTYTIADGVYYDTAKLSDYGKLARLDIEGLNEGERVSAEGKRNKTDFALWKFSPADSQRQMEWESPWGKGFPGWHLECTAMIFAELGEQIDIHTGGTDHIPVHHTNEIAQAEGAMGKPFVNYWLHGEFLVLDKSQRMGKSEGNFITLQTLIDEGFSPKAYRYLALGAHYKQFLTFSRDILKSAQTAYFKLKRLIQKLDTETGGADLAQTYATHMQEALHDDLNAPKVLGLLWEMVQDKTIGGQAKRDVVARIDEVLSLGLLDFSDFPEDHVVIPEAVQALAEERWQHRLAKDFAASDRLRDAIAEAGYSVKDSKDSYVVMPLDL